MMALLKLRQLSGVNGAISLIEVFAMRHLSSFALLLAFCVCSQGFSQQSGPATPRALPPASTSDPSVDFAALREQVSQQNKVLATQVANQRAIVRKDQELLREAQKLQAQNLKLTEEKKRLEAQKAELEKQRQALKARQKPTESTN